LEYSVLISLILGNELKFMFTDTTIWYWIFIVHKNVRLTCNHASFSISMLQLRQFLLLLLSIKVLA